MDGARAADDEKSVRGTGDDFNGFFAATENGLEGFFGGGNLFGEESRGDQGIVAEYWEVELVVNEVSVKVEYFTSHIVTDFLV